MSKRKHVIDEKTGFNIRDLIVLILLSSGFTNKQIASYIGVQLGTVKKLLGKEKPNYSILIRIGVENRIAALVWVKEHYPLQCCMNEQEIKNIKCKDLYNQLVQELIVPKLDKNYSRKWVYIPETGLFIPKFTDEELESTIALKMWLKTEEVKPGVIRRIFEMESFERLDGDES